jgi:aminopeptidase N
MAERVQEIYTNSPFIKLNIGCKGMYRVHYDTESWQAILTHAASTKFDVFDAWSLLNDALTLWQIDQFHLTNFIGLLEVLAGYEDYIIISKIFGWLQDVWIDENACGSSRVLEVIGSIFKPIWTKYVAAERT